MTAWNEATLRQIAAADPAGSVWLSANAGSGKTRVLTDRVARLLLAGTDPQHILCLTYTKAAATEMQNRLFTRLGTWSMCDDATLAGDLAALGEDGTLGPGHLARARTLFAQAMEVPGGLRIQTIHSFCAGLLRRFPMEAGVSPSFTEMEDRAAARLRAEVVDNIALGTDAQVVADLAQHYTGATFDTFLAAIVGQADRFAGLLDEDALRSYFGLEPGLTAEVILERFSDPALRSVLARLVPLLRTGKSTDALAADKLAGFLARQQIGLNDLGLLEDLFLFGGGAKVNTPFTAKIDDFPTKALRIPNPELMAELADVMFMVEHSRDLRLTLSALDRSLALHRFTAIFLPAYATRKSTRGLLDFDDLIRKAGALLSDPLVAQWVLFRLDGGLDHILVDEAQDTSPAQWDVIRLLASEFAAGQGARPNRQRTLFVVGDRKQSIYSFQGADPGAFDLMEEHFRGELGRIDKALTRLELEYSFRSSPAILRAVDMTFAHPRTKGLGANSPLHLAFHDVMPGRVDLWPAVPETKDDKDEGPWTLPVDRLGSQHHNMVLANALADNIAGLLNGGVVPVQVDGDWLWRDITPGDILILVRRRSEIFGGIIQALKARRLPVAGADRLKLGGELAVKDIAALLRFLALPEDNLSLAEALKSPLFGWTEQRLFTLAHHRPENAYLWEALRNAANDHTDTMAVLDDLRRQADFLRPYDLINRILVRHDGRRKLLRRLGPEAEDGIDALLAQALAFERAEVPGLTGFLSWLETDEVEVKRTLDAGGGLIRVMTVHAAKGLEAPIVILPDTANRKSAVTPDILTDGDLAFWPPRKEAMPDALLALRDGRVARDEDERRRLLYVAMTRAESWLIICAAGKAGPGEDSWHGMVQDGLTMAGAVTEAMPTGPGLRLRHAEWDGARAPMVVAPAPVLLPMADYPAIVPHDPALGRLRSPSDLGGAKVMAGDIDADMLDIALARGRFVHALLELLPGLDPAGQRTLATTILDGSPDAPMLEDAGNLTDQVMTMLANPALALLFQNGLAEVALTAPVADLNAERLTGQIDRLIIATDLIRVIDFKTNRLVPGTPDQVPDGILRQMGAYLAMVAAIWPDRPAQAEILWTATGHLMPLPSALCMAALRRAAVP